jgi:hypothetical protein
VSILSRWLERFSIVLAYSAFFRAVDDEADKNMHATVDPQVTSPYFVPMDDDAVRDPHGTTVFLCRCVVFWTTLFSLTPRTRGCGCTDEENDEHFQRDEAAPRLVVDTAGVDAEAVVGTCSSVADVRATSFAGGLF